MGDENEYIKLKVVGQHEIHFRVKQNTQMGKLKKSFSERVGVPVTSFQFSFDGRRIEGDMTPTALEMEQGDVIEVYQEMADKPKEVNDIIINITDEGPTRLENMTLTEVAQSIEKINADEPIIEAANNKKKDEHNEELAKLEVEQKIKLESLVGSLVESHKRKVDGIIDKHTTENNKYKKLRAEKQERKESFHSRLQALLGPPGQPAKPPPPPPSSLIPECPVCFESMKPPLQIFNCGNGHLVCSVCRPKLPIDKCHCLAMYTGRATAVEQIVKKALDIM